MKRSKGFTLVELLAVIAVFVVISAFLTAILITSIRGNNKTNTITVVRQNGTYAIEQISKVLRIAKTVTVPVCGSVASPTSSSTLTVTMIDSSQISYTCGSGTIASNGASLLDTSAVALSNCTFTCGRASATDEPVIGIDFFLTQKASTPFVDLTASASAIEFQTTVVMRNISF